MDKYRRTHAALRADPSLRDCINLQPASLLFLPLCHVDTLVQGKDTSSFQEHPGQLTSGVEFTIWVTAGITIAQPGSML